MDGIMSVELSADRKNLEGFKAFGSVPVFSRTIYLEKETELKQPKAKYSDSSQIPSTEAWLLYEEEKRTVILIDSGHLYCSPSLIKQLLWRSTKLLAHYQVR